MIHCSILASVGEGGGNGGAGGNTSHDTIADGVNEAVPVCGGFFGAVVDPGVAVEAEPDSIERSFDTGVGGVAGGNNVVDLEGVGAATTGAAPILTGFGFGLDCIGEAVIHCILPACHYRRFQNSSIVGIVKVYFCFFFDPMEPIQLQ